MKTRKKDRIRSEKSLKATKKANKSFLLGGLASPISLSNLSENRRTWKKHKQKRVEAAFKRFMKFVVHNLGDKNGLYIITDPKAKAFKNTKSILKFFEEKFFVENFLCRFSRKPGQSFPS